MSPLFKINRYIASAETKRDWLIHGHVAFDKCNVSIDHRGSKEQRSHSGIQSVPDFQMTSGLAAMLKESLQSIFYWS